MSATFDVMQQSLDFLKERVQGDQQAYDVIYYMKMLVDELHGYSHSHEDDLNRYQVTGVYPELVDISLRCADDRERCEKLSEWLEGHE